MAVKTIGDYDATYSPGDTVISVEVNTHSTPKYYAPFPTDKEFNDLFGTTDLPINIILCFRNCFQMLAAPKLPNKVSLYYSGGLTTGIFYGCSALLIPPKLPHILTDVKEFKNTFRGCTALTQGATIPKAAQSVYGMFYGATALEQPVSVPGSVTDVRYLYNGCSNITGEFIIRGTPSSYTNALRNTVKPLKIYGNKTTCEAIAATANNGNASWSAWYDPEPAVTNRGQGSYTTADEITRMVRNGALAVSSYAPGRMVYRQGDIVRADEWEALVEAAQTIDPTITLSTHYANLNKIEKAFDDAL